MEKSANGKKKILNTEEKFETEAGFSLCGSFNEAKVTDPIYWLPWVARVSSGMMTLKKEALLHLPTGGCQSEGIGQANTQGVTIQRLPDTLSNYFWALYTGAEEEISGVGKSEDEMKNEKEIKCLTSKRNSKRNWQNLHEGIQRMQLMPAGNHC
jgi:hypothetical protein